MKYRQNPKITPLNLWDIDKMAVNGNLYICKCGESGFLMSNSVPLIL